CQQGNTIPWTF
nr:immunoglobulin light chain junction region [Macaca mulatta]MOW40630.1 immunoglobulin light chain junction region [Macaca mulatta]MOW40640.1 immunoglobulin light chain junction region [Macaca mulatta]MOW41306.1 immunoglobulin light chain junction region [Macaca mulatta]MOW41336.1 immunoglobulin light chain junction region [Macaca mulatta]